MPTKTHFGIPSVLFEVQRMRKRSENKQFLSQTHHAICIKPFCPAWLPRPAEKSGKGGHACQKMLVGSPP